ncbi:MAG: DUF4058 family protein [Cyanobacteria bacterium P01_G01_bin.54]
MLNDRMPSPFPGMDPYLEGYLWPDVHHALASKIRQQLTPLLRPRYTARLEIYLAEDPMPEGELGILYPDVEVLEAPQIAPPLRSSGPISTLTPPTLRLPVVQTVSVRVATVEIRDTAKNRLVTSIEILSPVNKKEPGLSTYRQKRQRLYKNQVHLLEIDLLRRGTRPFKQPRLPQTAYCVALTRAAASQMELWSLKLLDALPVLPVPLQAPDADVGIDLGAALQAIYGEAAYDLSLDYGQDPPPPALTPEERDKVSKHLG